jgi:hypothetical protein
VLTSPTIFAVRAALDLLPLAEKYRALIALRIEREHLEARGIFKLHGHAAKARQRRGRVLARRFPGALRELDGLDVASSTSSSWRRAAPPGPSACGCR